MTQGGNRRPLPDVWPTELTQTLSRLNSASRVWVALSGGLDSTLLLHLAHHCVGRGEPGRLRAVHVNHQLQVNAAQSEAHCQAVCQLLAIPLDIEVVQVEASPNLSARTGGLEASARKARYQVFERLLAEGDIMLMAHHGDDQAETVLFRMLRGTGLAGLAGMPAERELGPGRLFRPLLPFSRDQLMQWALAAGLNWVDDPSNADERFDRNFLRHSILPILKTRWPNLMTRMRQTSRHCHEGSLLLNKLASIQHELCAGPTGQLRVAQLSRLSLPEQKNLLGWWVARARLPVPSVRHWDTSLPELLKADDDRSPMIEGDGFSIRRFRGDLYLVPDHPEITGKVVTLEPGKPVCWADITLTLEPAEGNVGLPPGLVVGSRQGGERIREYPEGPSKPLKKWLQEKVVPPWRRDQLPLIWQGDELIGVGDLWLSTRYTGQAPSSGWRVVRERDFD